MNLVVFLGAPGSGKGTQAKKLMSELSYTHLSTGDLLREAVRQNSSLGLKAKSYMDRGELVPDPIMIDLIREKMRVLKSNQTIILDGFPRTVPQAQALEDAGVNISKTIFFEVPEKELVERLTGRRTCPKCGESYHMIFLPPQKEGTCDRCGTSLVQRKDDTPEVVKNRLVVFEKQNGPLVEFYRKKKKLTSINAFDAVEDVNKTLIQNLKS